MVLPKDFEGLVAFVMFIHKNVMCFQNNCISRRWWKWSPIGANEWGNSQSSYLTSDSCWSLVTGCYKDGDVAAEGGHVGIVTGNSIVTSAGKYEILRNDWGFRPGQPSPTFWRYSC